MSFSLIEGLVYIFNPDTGNVVAVDANGSLATSLRVAGVEVDPRQIRTLTASDVVSAAQNGVWNINNITGTVSLPTGASTAANQTTANSSLSSIDGKISTEAKQDSIITNLGTIDTTLASLLSRAIKDAVNEYFLVINSDGSINSKVSQPAGETYDVRLRDDVETGFFAKVDATGNLYVVTPQPETPVGKTSLSDQIDGSNSGTFDQFTLIPSGSVLTIQRFRAGSEYDSNGGSVFTLYYAPNGNTTGLQIIDELYTNGNSIPVPLNYETPAGDGTASILLRFEHLSGGSIRMFTKWEGYY